MTLVKVKLSDIELSEQGIQELKALEAMPDSEIDYSDIPQLTEEFFRKAKPVFFHRSANKPVTLLIDADVLNWLRAKGGNPWAEINRILRDAMRSEASRTARPPELPLPAGSSGTEDGSGESGSRSR